VGQPSRDISRVEFMLSRRGLIFTTTTETFHHCGEVTRPESRNKKGALRTRRHSTQPLSIQVHGHLFDADGDAWMRNMRRLKCIGAVSRRILAPAMSFDTDALNVSAGISQIPRGQLQIHIIHGLPEELFQYALFWMPTARGLRRTV
jgi:hypothetical protein